MIVSGWKGSYDGTMKDMSLAALLIERGEALEQHPPRRCDS